jgi:hypothetical protein
VAAGHGQAAELAVRVAAQRASEKVTLNLQKLHALASSMGAVCEI